jgi:hypothetical protein
MTMKRMLKQQNCRALSSARRFSPLIGQDAHPAKILEGDELEEIVHSGVDPSSPL